MKLGLNFGAKNFTSGDAAKAGLHMNWRVKADPVKHPGAQTFIANLKGMADSTIEKDEMLLEADRPNRVVVAKKGRDGWWGVYVS